MFIIVGRVIGKWEQNKQSRLKKGVKAERMLIRREACIEQMNIQLARRVKASRVLVLKIMTMVNDYKPRAM